jgi:hypothetical protein
MPDVVLLPDGEIGRKQLVDDFEKKRGYWKLKKASLGWSQWRTRLRKSYGPVVRQTTECMIFWCNCV